MKVFEELKLSADAVILAYTPRAIEKHTRGSGYDKLALKLEDQALNGRCDPLAAEAALNDYSAHPPEDPALTSKIERGAKALANLVEGHLIDPVFAENALDRDLARWTVVAALDNRLHTEE